MSDRYRDYEKRLRDGGIPQDQCRRIIDDCIREDAFLDRQICPRCKGRLGRSEDPRQVGVSELAGTWFNYRCPCGYMVDRKE